MSLKYLITSLLEPISYLLFLSATLVYLIKKGGDLKQKVLATYFTLGFLLLVGIILMDPNAYLYGYLYLLTGVIFSFYFFLLLGSLKRSWLMLLSGLITILYYLFEQFFARNELFPSMGYVIVSSFIILSIFVYFYHLMTHVNEESLS